MSTAQEIRLTADDLLAMPDASRFELVNGELVERKMSEGSSLVGAEILRLIGNYVRGQSLGRVFGEGNGFRCFPDDPQQVRRADVAVVLKNRISGPATFSGYTEVSPNLVVEVISTHDKAYEVSDKIEEWLAAGVDEVWAVLPPAKTVTVHRAGQAPKAYREHDEIHAGSGAPGFRCLVADFFSTE